MTIEWIDELFVKNVSFENALDVKERDLNYLKKHGSVERNVLLFRYDDKLSTKYFKKYILYG